LQHIPQADILAGDLLIFDQNQEPRVGGICIIPFGEDWLIVRLQS
jgi:SOS-response transcriptional repressor LexA